MPVKQARGGDSRKDSHVPLPFVDSDDFPADILTKREFRLSQGRSGCDAAAPFKLQPAQQFVSTYMSPFTPYKSILLFHGTGVGKTCAAVQAAELQGGSSRRTLVLVPASIQGGFENNVYNAGKVQDGDVAGASRFQCTGSAYYTRDLEGMSKTALRKTQRSKGRKRYEFSGHDKFANTIETIEARAQRDFSGLGTEAVDTEIRATLRAVYDNRLIVVDEAHELRSDTGKKPSYAKLKKVLEACDNCRLILMSATPMFNRAVEIIDIVNLMRTNDRLPPISAKDVFDKGDTITPAGRSILKDAFQGRVSHMTYEDPASFPITLYPSEIGITGQKWTPPSKTRDGKYIPPNLRLRTDGEYELFCSKLSNEQEKIYDLPELKAVGAMMTAMQLENICYDGSSLATNEEAFFKAFKKVPGYGGRVVKYAGDVRYLHPSKVDQYAPKIAAASRLIDKADGLCFFYSNFRASGVYPMAIALEERGFIPYSGRPMLHDAPGTDLPNAPRYVIITKDDESKDTLSVSDKVDAANDPQQSNIKAVLGTETAAQGLDFKRVREVHVLEPWWNMSRIRQVIGRGVRRCSHITLPEHKRNTTVYLHCTSRSGSTETLDQRVYREAMNKNTSIRDVERVLAEAAIDCGLYEMKNSKNTKKETHQSSQGPVKYSKPRVRADDKIDCDIRWPAPDKRLDESTIHPYIYKNMIDLLAFEIKDYLHAKKAATFEEILAVTAADELILSLSLSTLMNPLLSWRWLGNNAMVYRGNLYAIVPEDMANQPFTLVEARMGFLFSSNPSARLTAG